MSAAASPAAAHLVVVLGAESTGKSDLCAALARALPEQGIGAMVVSEWLRDWCEREGRTPKPLEQAGIAQTQTERIAQAWTQAQAQAASTGAPQVVLADTSAWMTATYSQVIFGDASLWPLAWEAHRARPPAITLVTGNDLPWQPDGIQRDGAHMRAPVLATLRQGLQAARVPYSVVYGSGGQRTAVALQALLSALAQATPNIPPFATDFVAASADVSNASARLDSKPAETATRFSAWCPHCGDSDAACEKRLFKHLA